MCKHDFILDFMKYDTNCFGDYGDIYNWSKLHQAEERSPTKILAVPLKIPVQYPSMLPTHQKYNLFYIFVYIHKQQML